MKIYIHDLQMINRPTEQIDYLLNAHWSEFHQNFTRLSFVADEKFTYSHTVLYRRTNI